MITDSESRVASVHCHSDGSDISHSFLQVPLIATVYLNEPCNLCPQPSSGELAVGLLQVIQSPLECMQLVAMSTHLYLFQVVISLSCINAIVGYNVIVRIVHVSSFAAMVTIGHCVHERERERESE